MKNFKEELESTSTIDYLKDVLYECVTTEEKQFIIKKLIEIASTPKKLEQLANIIEKVGGKENRVCAAEKYISLMSKNDIRTLAEALESKSENNGIQ